MIEHRNEIVFPLNNFQVCECEKERTVVLHLINHKAQVDEGKSDSFFFNQSIVKEEETIQAKSEKVHQTDISKMAM